MQIPGKVKIFIWNALHGILRLKINYGESPHRDEWPLSDLQFRCRRCAPSFI
jgi:hypothetical protein